MPAAVVVGRRAERASRGHRARPGRTARDASSRARRRSAAGCRSAEFTLPGFVHDICSTVHSFALASPFLRSLPLGGHGFEPVHPSAPLAHPLDDGTAVMLERSPATDRSGPRRRRRGLPAPRGAARPRAPDALFEQMLARAAASARATRCCSPVSAAPACAPPPLSPRSRFEGERARALLAGCAAHSMLPLDAPVTAAYGLVLAASRRTRWVGRSPRGGSQRARRRARRPPARARRHGRDRSPWSPRSTSSTRAERGPARRHPAAAARPHRRTRLPDRYRRRSSATGPGPGSSSSTGRSTARSPGGRRRLGAPARCTLAARSRRSRPPSATSRGSTPSGPSCCSCSPRCSTRHAHRREAHRLGLLPRAERVDPRHERRHRGPGRALRARLSRADRRALAR